MELVAIEQKGGSVAAVRPRHEHALRHVAAIAIQRAFRNHTVRTIVTHLFDGRVAAAANGASRRRGTVGSGRDSVGEEDYFSDGGAGDGRSARSRARVGSAEVHEDAHVGVYYLSDTFGRSWGQIAAYRPDNYITKEKRSWRVRFDNGLDSFLTPDRLLDLTRQHGTWRQCPRDCRHLFIRIVSNPWFDRFILSVILINCVVLAMASPTLPADSQILKVIDVADVIFSVVFFVECALKLIACVPFLSSRSSCFPLPR